MRCHVFVLTSKRNHSQITAAEAVAPPINPIEVLAGFRRELSLLKKLNASSRLQEGTGASILFAICRAI